MQPGGDLFIFNMGRVGQLKGRFRCHNFSLTSTFDTVNLVMIYANLMAAVAVVATPCSAEPG